MRVDRMGGVHELSTHKVGGPPFRTAGLFLGFIAMSSSARDGQALPPAGGDASASTGISLPIPARLADVTTLSISGHGCTVVCVDDVLPRHINTRQGARAKLAYIDNEVAHFELGGHRYALLCDSLQPPPSASQVRDSTTPPIDIHKLLTNRELQIVQLVCMGCLTKQAADRLHISEFTVRSYLKTIYCKLDVRSRGAMVYRYAQAFNRGEERGNYGPERSA
jgi:DNA-binding CsgD family transcriptional regulator